MAAQDPPATMSTGELPDAIRRAVEQEERTAAPLEHATAPLGGARAWSRRRRRRRRSRREWPSSGAPRTSARRARGACCSSTPAIPTSRSTSPARCARSLASRTPAGAGIGAGCLGRLDDGLGFRAARHLGGPLWVAATRLERACKAFARTFDRPTRRVPCRCGSRSRTDAHLRDGRPVESRRDHRDTRRRTGRSFPHAQAAVRARYRRKSVALPDGTEEEGEAASDPR